jgi:riboflavin biosynthesis pyrimidine reductase
LQLPSLQLLFEEKGLPGLGIPGPLAQAYGGDLGLPARCVAANFVESLDGVVALQDAGGESGGMISGHNQADRFVMGLLRACADAVLIGAGTMRAAPGDLWFPESIFPEAAELFAELRRKLGLPPRPRLYVVTGSGDLDPAAPALAQGAIVVTTPRGAARLPSAGKLVLAQDPVPPAALIEALRAGGAERILCEGGPGLFAELVRAGQLDELFLTLSPRLFGHFAGDGRKALTDRADLGGVKLSLFSARRSGSHLFLRYQRA